jgi:hypothetical protein
MCVSAGRPTRGFHYSFADRGMLSLAGNSQAKTDKMPINKLRVLSEFADHQAPLLFINQLVDFLH